MYVDAVAAFYNLLQLCKCLISAKFEGNLRCAYIYVSWIGLLLDQVIASNLQNNNSNNNSLFDMYLFYDTD